MSGTVANIGCDMLSLLVSLQLALAQAAPVAPEADFDLRQVDPDVAAGDTIVVTGRRRPSQRLAPLPDLTESPLPRLETNLFGKMRLGTDVEPDTLGMPRAMVKVKIPF